MSSRSTGNYTNRTRDLIRRLIEAVRKDEHDEMETKSLSVLSELKGFISEVSREIQTRDPGASDREELREIAENLGFEDSRQMVTTLGIKEMESEDNVPAPPTQRESLD